MKDAKGHGSDPHGGESVGDKLYRLMKPPSMIPGYNPKLPAHQTGVALIPTVANADAIVDKLRAGFMPDLSGVTRAPAWVERFGLAARKGRGPV
jgi:hypothetical protein